MEIIGFSGYARSGKDEAAKVLVEEFGFKRVAFADKLREAVYQLNPMCGRGWDTSDHPVVYLQHVIDRYGWDGYKETEYGHEIRRLLHRAGTEMGRQVLGEDIWVDAALSGHVKSAKIVLSDCRFPNEYKAIKARGGSVWRITREGVGPANSHASETSLDGYSFDAIINNNASLEAFQRNVRNYYKYSRVGAK